MITYFKENIQLYGIMLFIMLCGMFAGPIIYIFGPLTIILMLQKGMLEEVILVYFFILILSDSYYPPFLFAKNFKSVYLVLLAGHFFLNRRESFAITKAFKIFLPFFIYSLIPLFFIMEEPFFFESLQKTFSYFFSFLVVSSYIEKLYRKEGTEFFKRFSFLCFAFLIIGFILKFAFYDLAYLSSGRYRGVFGNPNGLGMYAFFFFIIFFLFCDVYPELFTKRQKISVFSAIIISLVMTYSRNVIIAVFIFFFFQRVFKSSVFIGFIMFCLILYLINMISANMVQIINELNLQGFFRLNTLMNASGRYVAWDFAWKNIQQNLFIGRGFGYDDYYMHLHYDELSILGHQGGVHNSFLSFWMNTGLVGLLIYLRSYFLMFFNAAKKTRFSYPIMFALSVTATFESWLVGSLSAFAFLGVFIFTVISDEDMILQHQGATVE